MKKLLFLLLLTAGCLHARNSPIISSGRPGMGIGSDVLGTKTVQFQGGALLTDQSLSGEYTLRIGLSSKLEVNTNWSNTFDSLKTWNQPALGFRYELTKEKHSRFSSALQFGVVLPIQTGETVGQYFTFSWGKYLSDEWSFGSNQTVTFTGIGGDFHFSTNFALTHQHSDRWSSYVELFANAHEQDLNILWDVGTAILLTNNIQWDLFGSYHPWNSSNAWFLSSGLSIRNW